MLIAVENDLKGLCVSVSAARRGREISMKHKNLQLRDMEPEGGVLSFFCYIALGVRCMV